MKRVSDHVRIRIRRLSLIHHRVILIHVHNNHRVRKLRSRVWSHITFCAEVHIIYIQSLARPHHRRITLARHLARYDHLRNIRARGQTRRRRQWQRQRHPLTRGDLASVKRKLMLRIIASPTARRVVNQFHANLRIHIVAGPPHSNVERTLLRCIDLIKALDDRKIHILVLVNRVTGEVYDRMIAAPRVLRAPSAC